MYNNSPPLARCFHISVVFIIITIIITPVLAHGPQSVEAAQVGGGADILPGDKQNIRQDYHPHTLTPSHPHTLTVSIILTICYKEVDRQGVCVQLLYCVSGCQCSVIHVLIELSRAPGP